MFTFVDLFSGIGGIRLGLERAGGRCVCSCDIDRNANVTYKANFNEDSYGDITKINPADIPRHDLLAGGFPCQSFSVAGRRLGFEDTRGTLFFDLARIIRDCSPETIFLENVKGLVNHDEGRTLATIRTVLEDLGYHLHVGVLSPHTHANIPQNRERVFIVGSKKDSKFSFPEKTPLTRKWREFIEAERQNDRFYYKNEKSPSYRTIVSGVKDRDSIYQYRRFYVRENKNGLCPTLTANMGLGGHNVPLILDDWGVRKLTPRECARFQGFPDPFILPRIGSGSGDTHLYRQIGNSVCVEVICRIAGRI